MPSHRPPRPGRKTPHLAVFMLSLRPTHPPQGSPAVCALPEAANYAGNTHLRGVPNRRFGHSKKPHPGHTPRMAPPCSPTPHTTLDTRLGVFPSPAARRTRRSPRQRHCPVANIRVVKITTRTSTIHHKASSLRPAAHLSNYTGHPEMPQGGGGAARRLQPPVSPKPQKRPLHIKITAPTPPAGIQPRQRLTTNPPSQMACVTCAATGRSAADTKWLVRHPRR
jgi:hypothetical protein